MKVDIKILPVFQGDSIIMLFNKREKSIMIDAGTRRSYTKGIIKDEISQLGAIDLLVLTHTDEDHIGGILKYYEDKKRKTDIFKNVWFNSGTLIGDELSIENGNKQIIKLKDTDDLNVSIGQGITLEKMLKSENNHFEKIIKSRDTYDLGFANIIVISPDVEDLRCLLSDWEVENEKHLEVTGESDYNHTVTELVEKKFIEKGTLANKTSIALLIESNSLKFLFLGDSFPTVIERNLRKLGYSEENKLKIDLVKVSHHGSNFATSPDLLKIIDCTKFVISTNASNGLPNKECLARIVTHRKEKVTLFFNYRNETIENIFFENEFKEHNFDMKYLNEENNFTISISE